MNAPDRRYYTTPEEFSKAVAKKMVEKAVEHDIKIDDIQVAAIIKADGVRLYMCEGEQLFATRIDEFGFYFLENPKQKFKPIK